MPDLPTLPTFLTRVFGLGVQIVSAVEENNKLHELFNYVYSTFSAIDGMLQIMQYVMEQEKGAVDYALPKVSSGMEGLAEIAANENIMWDHLIDKLLPASLAFLNGYVFSTGIVPLRNRMAQAERLGAMLNAHRQADEKELYNVVVPAVKDWLTFDAWWNKYAAGPVGILIDWINHPNHFGDWAAAPVIGPIVGYLADPQHKDTRDNFSEIMVNAWAERPERTLNAITQWLVTEIP